MARNTAPMPFSWRITLTRKRATSGIDVGEVGAVVRLEALQRGFGMISYSVVLDELLGSSLFGAA